MSSFDVIYNNKKNIYVTDLGTICIYSTTVGFLRLPESMKIFSIITSKNVPQRLLCMSNVIRKQMVHDHQFMSVDNKVFFLFIVDDLINRPETIDTLFSLA